MENPSTKNAGLKKISDNDARAIEMRMINDPEYKRMTEQPVDRVMPVRRHSLDEINIALLRL